MPEHPSPAPAPRRNRRDDLLDAFARLVLEQGERAATLEAVAAAADVSKGGLLYHFSSREALVAGLCERFAALVEADIAAATEHERSLAEWYLRTSSDYDSPLERTMAALMRLAQHHDAVVRPALLAGRERWYALILDDLGDERLAHAVLLLGDGVAYNSEMEGPAPDAPRRSSAATVDGLVELVRALRMLRS
ncbi:MAG: TetR/AcrR family transcriptional regulator [Microbacteriaceae bacterium]|nr:TetR/AcrR family transcriptional regulator [Microbacteriaceae bacterium]